MFALLLSTALAAPADYVVAGVGGLGGGAGTPSPLFDQGISGAGYVVGRLLIQGQRATFEVGAREGLASADARSWGGLFAGARLELGERTHVRVGFAHHHEVELSLAEEEPLAAMLGSLPGIRHRSGAELGVGLLLPVEERMLDDRLGVGLDLAVNAFPDTLGPRAYAFLDLNVEVGLSRRRVSGGSEATPPEAASP